MFKPVEMCKINVLVLNRHLNDVTQRLGDQGVIHLVDAAAQSEGGLLNSVEDQAEQEALHQLIEQCDRLIRQLGVDEQAEVPHLPDMSRPDIEALLQVIDKKLTDKNDEMAKLIQDAGGMEQLKEKLNEYPVRDISLEVLQSLSHFNITAGRLAPSLLASARAMIADRGLIIECEGKEGNVLVLSSRKNRWVVADELSKLGFKPIEPPESVVKGGSVDDNCRDLDDKLLLLQAQLEAGRLAVLKIGELYSSVLLSMRVQLHGMLAVQLTRRHFGQLAHLACISGWIPKAETEHVKQLVAETTGGTGIVVVIDVDEDEFVKAGLEQVPTKMQGNALTRPFQMLVCNFGIPAYKEIDPTIFVGITFVILFGFMFGDVGQGLVLALAGLWMRLTKRKLADSMRDVGTLLMLCGGCATLFGFAYGSIFGYEHLLRPLWVNPLNFKKTSDIATVLAAAIGVGTIFSSVAIIINIVNHFIARKYFDGTFDRFGVIGLLFYWLCLGIGIWLLTGHAFSQWMLVPLLLPLALLCLKEPIDNLLHRHGLLHGGAFAIALGGCLEILETLTGYMSGTVSFVRVGAFAISHAALCFAVFKIVELLAPLPCATAWQFCVIVIGNALVIGFEGMVAMIQGLRLEYYELFGKFFGGGGVAYAPFSLKQQPKK